MPGIRGLSATGADSAGPSAETLIQLGPVSREHVTGDALFFTNYTWHRSEPNRTGRTLTYYAIAYQLTAAAIAARSR
ncbi:MAG: hypothetical protein CMJ49_03190 [Planctomycetaceae bacterium]|nr:hypothetical protein [Planctomycetaceae bacterium]